MKKITLFSIAAIIMPAIALTSCSDDDNDKRSLQIPEGVDNIKTITSDQAIFTLPIEADGAWTASVNDDADWIALPVTQGSGDADLEVYVDPNIGTEIRIGGIEITNGQQTISYSIAQGSYYEEYDENSINYATFGKNTTPLGFALRIKKNGNKALPTNMVMNFTGFSKLTKDEKANLNLGDDCVCQVTPQNTKIELNTAHSYKDQNKGIKATLSVTVGFGLAKIGLKGGFSLDRHSSDNTYGYSAATTIPNSIYSIDNYDEYMENALSSNLQSKLLGSKFCKLYNNIVSCFDENGEVSDQTNLDKHLKTLDTNFGPVFCSSASMGGSVNLNVTANKETSTDTMTITGSLSVGFNAAFSINAEATASYLQAAAETLEEINVSADIQGGDINTHSDILVSLQKVLGQPDDMSSNTKTLLDAITNWRNSLSSSNTVLTDFDLTGIWELFKHSDSDIQDAMQTAIKEYMCKTYPNDVDAKGNETCPYLVNIQELAQ